MYKTLLLIAIIVSIHTIPKAQSRERYLELKRKEKEEALKQQPESVVDITKFTLLLPGVSHEKAVGKFQTLQAYALYNLNTYSKNNGNNIQSSTYFDPTIMLSYRYYCNYKRRVDLGRSTAKNTMNYIGPFAQVFFSKIPIGSNAYEYKSRRPVYTFGVLYGLQRNYKSHFSLDINFGVGVITGKSLNSNYSGITENNEMQFTIPGQITLGFWL